MHLELGNCMYKALRGKLPFLLVLGVMAKLLVDTTVQIFNPFLIVIAGGVGVSTLMMGRIFSMRSLVGLIAPLLGSIADRVGHKVIMRASLLVSGVAMILAPATGSVLVFAVAIVLAGAAQSGYTPNIHAYLSSKLTYEKRAMGLGIIEYSWALAGIVGLSVSGYLMDAISWKAPFYVLGAGLVLMSFVFGLLPDENANTEPVLTKRGSFRDFIHLGEHRLSAWSAIGITGLNMFAIMHVMIIHGGWLQAEYGLSPSRLGTVALIFGLADLTASVLVSVFVDRIGKRRSVMIGVAGMAAGCAVMPLLNTSLVLAVISIMAPRMFFEFAVVSNFPLLSEQVPDARGKVMSLAMSAGLLGATLAGLTGPAAYLRLGVWGLGPVSCAAALASFCLLTFFIRERPHRSVANKA